MASRSQQPVGSHDWLVNEREQYVARTDEIIEEFGFLVENDLRWLNAHMDGLVNSDKVSVHQCHPQSHPAD